MDELETVSEVEDAPPRRWVPHLVWAVLIVGLGASMILAAYLTKPGKDDCEGIGWGCDLYGPDAALVTAIVVVPICVFLLLVGHGVMAAISWYRHRDRSTPAP